MGAVSQCEQVSFLELGELPTPVLVLSDLPWSSWLITCGEELSYLIVGFQPHLWGQGPEQSLALNFSVGFGERFNLYLRRL